jgi:glucose-1-phosphate thymidylyltransferase
VVIEGSTLDHSVIMEECVIRNIARMENSVVGRRVHVRPTGADHDAISLMVGDDCVVEVKKR